MARYIRHTLAFFCSDWSPHIERSVRAFAAACCFVYTAGWFTGMTVHRWNEQLAAIIRQFPQTQPRPLLLEPPVPQQPLPPLPLLPAAPVLYAVIDMDEGKAITAWTTEHDAAADASIRVGENWQLTERYWLMSESDWKEINA